MIEESYDYIIVGAGLAGASAVRGIREVDDEGAVLLIGSETFPPYHRPPLTKGLWLGKKRVEDIFVLKEDFYIESGIDTAFDTTVIAINPDAHTITDDREVTYEYGSLLLATGGTPRKLPIPGGDLEGIIYYRALSDYITLHQAAEAGKSVLVIGGGFIGSEIAAALHTNELAVTMLFPEQYLASRVFPAGLGLAVTEQYREKGITVHAGDVPTDIARQGEGWAVTTQNGLRLEADLLVVGIGITPSVELAKQAGLAVSNGIEVNEYLQTSDPAIFAAGDNALFPYPALNMSQRVEHWDNAKTGGKFAGKNMAGAGIPYDYMPYFYSDLFEFGYEAVGQVDARLQTVEDWQQEYHTGVIYYLQDGNVRGAMMCNVWEKVDAARDLIRTGKTLTPDELRGAIR
jgi:NADPH-dependent 2,4-dienoyl-CoA reductase/sulfur reductase-like enzyme